MKCRVAVVGAGVSGLTTSVVLSEAGFNVSLLADEVNQQTTSAVAGAMWFPYDAEPAQRVIPWALETYKELESLVTRHSAGHQKDDRLNRSGSHATGVSLIELRQFSRDREIEIPGWAHSLGVKPICDSSLVVEKENEGTRDLFRSGFSLSVPLTDTTIYLDYLEKRLSKTGAVIQAGVHLENLEEIDSKFDLIVNCAGIGARELVGDSELEPHRGQVVIVPKIASVRGAMVCDDAPLMYVIPRANDCLFGGTNEVSHDRKADPSATSEIVAECCRVLNIDRPKVLAERVGLRPFRKSGVRLERNQSSDGRTVIHNYGHGGAGFTLSWGCAREVLRLALQFVPR